MTRAMLLCAGLSTRLGPLGQAVPKPLLPIANVPIIRFGVALLKHHGISDIVINLHHQGHLFREVLGDGQNFGVRIQYSEESVILGTGGGLKAALPLLDPHDQNEPFVSLNGKLIFDVNLLNLLNNFREVPKFLGTMVVRAVPNAKDWGAVDVAANQAGNLVVRDILSDGKYMFCGVHVTTPHTVRRLPDGEACMIRQGYLPWLKQGEEVGAWIHEHGYFAEHSVPQRYWEGNSAILGGQRLAFWPEAEKSLPHVDSSAQIDSSATILAPVAIAARAKIASRAVIGPLTAVGADAVVEEGINLDRCIVWPGAHAKTSGTGLLFRPDAEPISLV